MLNIPETVKALFKADGIRKNFRVQFPNGELDDLTNADIVQESVSFTESLCSQDVLKFGPCEASVIEFETVGAANMFGMTIRCGIEIDLSSLSAADLADIATGIWDGTYVPEAESDLGYGYFRVPYGDFRVESCPRDHQAMTHRRVQAYTASPKDLQLSRYERNKLAVLCEELNYTPDLYKLFLSQFAHDNQAFLLNHGFTVGAAISLTSAPSTLYVTNMLQSDEIRIMTDGGSYRIRGRVEYLIGYTTGAMLHRYDVDRDKIYAVNYGDAAPDTILSRVADALQAGSVLPDIDLAASGFSSWKELAAALFTSSRYSSTNESKLKMLYPQVEYSSPHYSRRTFTVTEEDKAIYPRIGSTTYESGGETLKTTRCWFCIPSVVTIKYATGAGATLYTENITNPITINQYDDPADLPSFPATYNPTYDIEQLRSFIDCYSMADIMDGMLEMSAAFGRITRDGATKIMNLNNDSPVPIPPGEYSQLWWDEFDVDPIGVVRFSFTGEDRRENIIDYYFGPGNSGYDMSGNAALSHLTGTPDTMGATIKALLDTHFIPLLGPITFTPVDLSMKGLPYLEPGDYMAVTTEDGETAYSFNMRQTIRGVQALTTEIESVSGQILESLEAY